MATTFGALILILYATTNVVGRLLMSTEPADIFLVLLACGLLIQALFHVPLVVLTVRNIKIDLMLDHIEQHEKMRVASAIGVSRQFEVDEVGVSVLRFPRWSVPGPA